MIRRTHTCGELRREHAGQRVALCGWVDARRNHGNLIFVDVRDRHGITQLIFDRGEKGGSEVLLDQADRLRLEDVIAVCGTVRRRAGGVNPRLATGEIEVLVAELQVLAKATHLPFQPADEDNLPAEETRLRYRYLDLRRPRMQQILQTRHRVLQITRDYFSRLGFLEVETPILYKSTPEGAREFLVPSRHVPGTFYALPQSPQLFKQILMVAGCDRYMQICRCFRDEDPRADRQAEFSQVDLEMSFVEREDVMEVMEGYIRRLWGEVLGVDVGPMRRMTWREAVDRYGIDRPDLRVGMEIEDISALAARTTFNIFRSALERGGVVRAFVARQAGERLSRAMLDGYAEFVRSFGAGGVSWTRVAAGPDGTPAFAGGIARFLEPVATELCVRLAARPGDVVLFAADLPPVAARALGELRLRVAHDLGMLPAWGRAWEFLWVLDFPMFERDRQTGRWLAMHHPFTAPRSDQIEAFLRLNPADEQAVRSIVSAGYDMVVNGSEIAGGSIRIHDPALQNRVFALLGLSEDEARDKFGFLLEALRCGAPPHGGIAFGLDRIIMHLCGTENIRDVIAFPKTQTGQDLMTGAPSRVSEHQLRELHIRSTWPEWTGPPSAPAE